MKSVLAALAVAFVLFIFTFYVDGEMGIILIAFLLIAPLLSLAMAVYARKRIRVSFDCDGYVKKGGELPVTVTIEKEGWCPLAVVEITPSASEVFEKQEKSYRFPGFSVQKRSIRQYEYPYAAHVLGDVAEVSEADIEMDDYYQPGDYIGKLGVERFYEKQLRGEKGIQVLLRDAHGRIQGSYRNGAMDKKPVPGKNLTLAIDKDLQALAERLLEGKIGSVVAIEPKTGEVLCEESQGAGTRPLETFAQPQHHGPVSAGLDI